MKSKEIAIIQRKIRVSRATSILSMSLVLFMLGMVGFLLLNAHHISKYVQENVGITLMLRDELTGKEIEPAKINALIPDKIIKLLEPESKPAQASAKVKKGKK